MKEEEEKIYEKMKGKDSNKNVTTEEERGKRRQKKTKKNKKT